MNAEVVVVGGGIGGLTVAALLAARGVDVCLCEREANVGGCAANFDKFGYSFEPGFGLYPMWGEGEIHRRVFSELPVKPPEVRLHEPSYAVSLPDQSAVTLTANTSAFEANLAAVFPECNDEAIKFYRELEELAETFRQVTGKTSDFFDTESPRRLFGFLRSSKEAARLLEAGRQRTKEFLGRTSFRFTRFIDTQLQTLAQATSESVPYLYAAVALTAARSRMYGIDGGASSLANRLAESIEQSGGRIRLNTPVLRLAYDTAGDAVGVDLLSGEQITASKAIISNLTQWDTYGKLVGLNRTPADVRQQLKGKRGWGAYLLYLGWDDDAARRASSNRLLALTAWQDGTGFSPENDQLFFSSAPDWDRRAPEGKRAVTVQAFTDVDDWFTFHTDESDLETKDQQMLEQCWTRLHQAMPHLGDSIEVIDTATPRSYYEQTRRKLGMVGGLPVDSCEPHQSYLTSIPNLFMVGDTVSPGGISGLSRTALALANRLTKA